MVTIRLSTTVGADRKLVLQLPEEIPAGEVEIEIRVAEKSPEARKPYEIPYNPAREAARAKLRAAGILAESTRAPEGTVPMSPEEILAIGAKAVGGKSILDLVNEDRGEW